MIFCDLEMRRFAVLVSEYLDCVRFDSESEGSHFEVLRHLKKRRKSNAFFDLKSKHLIVRRFFPTSPIIPELLK